MCVRELQINWTAYNLGQVRILPRSDFSHWSYLPLNAEKKNKQTKKKNNKKKIKKKNNRVDRSIGCLIYSVLMKVEDK